MACASLFRQLTPPFTLLHPATSDDSRQRLPAMLDGSVWPFAALGMGNSPSAGQRHNDQAQPRRVSGVGWSDWLACTLSLQTLRFAAHDLATRHRLQLPQCLADATEVVTMPLSELSPMRAHFFDHWITTHHLHP